MYNKNYEIWLNSPYVDDELKKELKEIEKIESEIEDRFYKDLEFGTGGMRGKIGAGTNRMNLVTVAKATQGIANYLIEKYKSEEISAAIAYDSRNMSKEFAEKAACVFAANNIWIYEVRQCCYVILPDIQCLVLNLFNRPLGFIILDEIKIFF
jgi:phosphoglucomutase